LSAKAVIAAVSAGSASTPSSSPLLPGAALLRLRLKACNAALSSGSASARNNALTLGAALLLLPW
jgi:hypothetical protein